MKFDADRLASLAGLGSSRSGALNEASNRTQHDEKYYQDEVPHRVGKNQLSETERPTPPSRMKELDKGMAGTNERPPMDELDKDVEEMHHAKMEMKHGDMEEMGHAKMEMKHGDMEEAYDDVVLEIDEDMLKKEIKKMRAQRINENNLRMAVRNEIQDIFGELGLQQGDDWNSWVYGSQKPTNSRAGSVTTSFPGIGFKK